MPHVNGIQPPFGFEYTLASLRVESMVHDQVAVRRAPSMLHIPNGPGRGVSTNPEWLAKAQYHQPKLGG